MQEAMARGLVVAKPYGDSLKYDFIVESGGKFSRVQVRACFGRIRNRYRLSTATGKKSEPYTADQIDFIAACAVPAHAWYIIPVHEISGRVRIALASHERRGYFEKFRDAWELLTVSAS